MRLLVFNLATDADDTVLGFTTSWIRALAERVEFVHVVTMRVGRLALPGNVRVHSLGKEKGYSELRRLWEFYKILARILRGDRVDACFSHMNPLFTVLAGPILKTRKIPIFTWYAHSKVTRMLKIAHWFSFQMISSLSSAYRYRHDKLVAIGQGIDTELFCPDANVEKVDCPIILCVGRLSPVKDHPTLIRAAWCLRQVWTEPFRVIILGDNATARDREYVRSLHQQVKELNLEDIVAFESAVPLNKLPAWYRRATVYVNMTPTGSGDKVAWEAMACGLMSVVANEGFKDTLGIYADRCVYDYGNAESLTDRLEWALSLPDSERTAIGGYFRKQVEANHGLSRLAQKLVSLFDAALPGNDSCCQGVANPDALRPKDV